VEFVYRLGERREQSVRGATLDALHLVATVRNARAFGVAAVGREIRSRFSPSFSFSLSLYLSISLLPSIFLSFSLSLSLSLSFYTNEQRECRSLSSILCTRVNGGPIAFRRQKGQSVAHRAGRTCRGALSRDSKGLPCYRASI